MEAFETTSNFMVVNVAWNHAGWARLEPNPAIRFGYVKRHGGLAFSPHESLNFDFCKKGIDTSDTVYGYFQTRGLPRQFVEEGVIFFLSRSTDDHNEYLIGVYGNAGVLDKVKKRKYRGFENDEFWANIKGEKKLSCLFPCPVQDSKYKPNGKRLIYRSNLTYNFNKSQALQLLKDARTMLCGETNYSGAIETLLAIEEYVKRKP